jgi:hypothetical protein
MRIHYTFNNQSSRTYTIEDALAICQEYIYVKTRKVVRLKLNINNLEEVKLFEEACQSALHWYETEILDNKYDI